MALPVNSQKQCPQLPLLPLSFNSGLKYSKNHLKKLQEDIFSLCFAQVACHICVTFSGQNNSKLPLVAASVSCVRLSHALCVDSEGNLLKNTANKSFICSKRACVCEWVWEGVEGQKWEQCFLCLDGLFIWKPWCLSMAQGGWTSMFSFCRSYSQTIKLLLSLNIHSTP